MDSHSTTSSHILRYLDSFEEHFWLLEKVTSRSHMLVVRISGSASQEQWRKAVGRVQQHYVVLNASIGKSAGERPFFHSVSGRKIPLEFLELTDDVSLESFAEAGLLRSFGAGEGPLTRISIFSGEEHSAVIVSSHHSALDGRSHLYMVRDVLTVLARGELPGERQSIAPSASSLFERTIPPYDGRSPLNEGDPLLQVTHAIPQIHVVRYSVQKAKLDVLLTACKAKGVSFHSALLVAIARAGSRLSEQWQRDGVRALTPVDVRSRFGLEGRLGVLFTLHRIVLEPSVFFWAEATRLNESLKPQGINEASRRFYTLAESLVSQEHSPGSHIAGIAGTEFVHDLMLTNYGVLEWQGVGSFRIDDMFTAGIAGHLETQKVAAVTLNGSLNLTLVGQRPIPGLLEAAIEELYAACKGQY